MDAKKWMPKNGCQQMDAKKWMPKNGCQKMDAKQWMPKNGCQKMDANKMDANKMDANKMDANKCRRKSASALLRRHLLASIFWHPFFASLPLAHSWMPKMDAARSHGKSKNDFSKKSRRRALGPS